MDVRPPGDTVVDVGWIDWPEVTTCWDSDAKYSKTEYTTCVVRQGCISFGIVLTAFLVKRDETY